MTIDHLLYAAKRLDQALKASEGPDYVFAPIIDDVDRNVKICFREKDGYRVELVHLLYKEAPSLIDVYLRDVELTFYHICLGLIV